MGRAGFECRHTLGQSFVVQALPLTSSSSRTLRRWFKAASISRTWKTSAAVFFVTLHERPP